MNAYCWVELLLSQTKFHGNCKSLHNLSSMRPREMQTNNFIGIFMNHCFGVSVHLATASILIVLIQHIFLQRCISDMIHTYILPAEISFGLFLTQATTTILKWGKYSGWIVVKADRFFIGREFSFPQLFDYPSSQVPSHFGSCTCQLRQSFNHIS